MAESNPVSLPRRTIAGKARVTDPGFRRENGQAIPDNERSYINESIKVLRSVDPVAAIRALSRFHGVFSTAIHSYIQLAMSGYTLTGYQAGTHLFDLGITQGAKSMAVSADTLYDYTVGYADKQGIDSLLETLLKEVVQTGACCTELVLNRFRLPERILPVPVPSLNWVAKANGTKYPEQIPVGAGGGPISLDLPTIFYSATHQQSDTVFARSPMEAALNTVFVFTEFLEDMYRILRKSGHSRMVVTIIQEEAMKTAPPDIQSDPDKMKTYLNNVRTEIETLISGLEPDEAIVTYDTATAEILSAKGEKADYTALLDSFSGMLATSLKSMPSTLGLRISGSQSLSNTESLIFLKMVKAIQAPVESVMSRAFTLATRLMTGTDGYVKFAFNPIDLRPSSELSAHRSVDNARVLSQLSLGFLTDDEAAHILGTGARPAGAPPLSGTFFQDVSSTQPRDMNDNSGAQERNLSEGTENGSATSSGGGSNNA